MTIAERRRQQFFRSKLNEDEMDEHYDDGTRQHESASYEGTVYQCSCGERFVDRNELLAHVSSQGMVRWVLIKTEEPCEKS